MRIATMILSLILMLVVGLQSCAVSVGDASLNEPTKSQGGAIGILIAFLFLIGGAFALVFPLVSLVAFVLAGIFGLSSGDSSEIHREFIAPSQDECGSAPTSSFPMGLAPGPSI